MARKQNYFYGNDPETRRKQVTHKTLRESGTLVWIELDSENDFELSAYSYDGGRVCLRIGGRWTTIRMETEKAIAVHDDQEAFAQLTVRMLNRMDSNKDDSYYKHKKFDVPALVDDEVEFVNPVEFLGVSTFEDNAGLFDIKPVVLRTLRQMTDRQAEVWVQHALLGKGFAEIGREIGIGRDSVRKSFVAAQQKLREACAEFYDWWLAS